jgi:SAM-dependent methyltransferase
VAHEQRPQRPAPVFEQGWRARFIDFARSHDDDAGIAGWTPTGLAARLRRFARVWPGDRADALWLDVGCGAGTYARFLGDHGLRVIGLDYSLPALHKARGRGSGRLRWAAADATALPVRPGLADGVLCFGVLQALAHSGPAVRELVQAVRPGGRVWIDALNAWCVPHALERVQRRAAGRPVHLRYESPWRLVRLMRHSGLEQVRYYWLPIAPVRWQRLQPLLESPVATALLRIVPPLGALLSHSVIVTGLRPQRGRR